MTSFEIDLAASNPAISDVLRSSPDRPIYRWDIWKHSSSVQSITSSSAVQATVECCQSNLVSPGNAAEQQVVNIASLPSALMILSQYLFVPSHLIASTVLVKGDLRIQITALSLEVMPARGRTSSAPYSSRERNRKPADNLTALRSLACSRTPRCRIQKSQSAEHDLTRLWSNVFTAVVVWGQKSVQGLRHAELHNVWHTQGNPLGYCRWRTSRSSRHGCP